VVPAGVGGHTATFPLGGKATPKVTWKSRINLTLGYDPSTPGGRDLAVQIRTRLEDTGGLSVKLTPGDTGADLQLLDRKAWTATALAWLQPYLEAPLPEVAQSVSTLATQFRGTTDPAAADRLLAALQRQSASDLVVLPISQSDEHLYARTGVEVSTGSFGPGWQLGLWGIGGG
jgi:peptide/nickel transport system substrate-binding protein